VSLRSGVTNYDFVGKSRIFVTLSIIAIAASLLLFFTKGLRYGIDFAGGTELQLKFQKEVSAGDIRTVLESLQMRDAVVQSLGDPKEREFLIRVTKSSSDPERFDANLRQSIQKNFPDNNLLKVRYVADRAYLTFQNPLETLKLSQAIQDVGGNELKVHDVAIYGKPDNHEYTINFSGLSTVIAGSLEKKFGTGSFELRREDTVGPKVGKELRVKGVMSMLVTLVLLLIYIWFRFDIAFAPGALLALFHDVAITIGVFCLFGFEMNLTVMAGLLTLVGYSLNDTIVVYDRIRENMKRMKDKPLAEIINASINQTLSRTIMTSGATMLVTIALMIWGGDIIFNFAFALSFGIVVGTYSSIYIASPLTILLNRMVNKKA
jgi:preprotein translocase subunit SecF